MTEPRQSDSEALEDARTRYHGGLFQVSAIAGREVLLVGNLSDYLSEGALHRYRALVQVSVIIALSESDLPQRPVLSDIQKALLLSLVTPQTFDARAVADYDHFGRNGMKPLEHDVKAVETYLRERFDAVGLSEFKEWIHFPMTSEDVNNLAWNLMIRDAINHSWLPTLLALMDQLAEFSRTHANVAVLGITHGQKASPTTFGKRFAYVLGQICDAVEQLKTLKLTGKFSGATGNHNAMVAVVPEFDMDGFTRRFVEGLGFVYANNCHQRNSHQSIVRLLNEVRMINICLIDFCEQIRHSVMMGWFIQVGDEGHAGSSVMPNKINPWEAEVAQGYLEQAIHQIEGMGTALMQSVFERDLTDHPYEREYGTVFAKSVIALKYLISISKNLRVNARQAREELIESPEVMSEAINIAGRLCGTPDVYTRIKVRTRGQPFNERAYFELVDEVVTDAAMRDRLLGLFPDKYTGLAAQTALRAADRYLDLRPTLVGGILDQFSHITAVLFDFDGTLHDGDKHELFARLTEISRRLDLGFTSEQIRVYGNRSDYQEMRAMMVRDYNTRTPPAKQIPETAFTEANNAVSGQFDHYFLLAPQTKELLIALKRSSKQTALVTTRGSNSLHRLLKHYGINDLFDTIVHRDDCQERKPHPKPVALALEKLGIKDPARVLFIGDKQADDVAAGNALRMETVHVGQEQLDPYGARPTYHYDSLQPLLRAFSRSKAR